MCFTININTSRNAIEKRFHVDTSALKDLEFRYFYKAFDNPLLPVITQQDPGRAQLMQWGLIPSWARNNVEAEKIRSGTYNARAETLQEKASFKSTVESQRCWILVAGFYEWQSVNKEKIPWFIHLRERDLFALAGVYDHWVDPETGIGRDTFSIITTEANPLMEKIHNTKKRMPLILDPSKENTWLEPMISKDKFTDILSPFDEKQMSAYTISKKISMKNADPGDPDIIKPYTYFVDRTLF